MRLNARKAAGLGGDVAGCLGRTEDAILGDGAAIRSADAAVIAAGEPSDSLVAEGATGAERWRHVTRVPIRDARGRDHPPCHHRARRHRAEVPGGAPAAVGQDAGAGNPGRRHRPRLQQPADGDPRQPRTRRAEGRRPAAGPAPRRQRDAGGPARRLPDQAPPQLQPLPRPAPPRRRRERPDHRDARPARRQPRRPRHRRDDPRPRGAGRLRRPGPARTRDPQPLHQCPRRHAGGRRIVVATRSLALDDDPDLPAGDYLCVEIARCGQRHRPGDPRAGLRAVLHHQGGGPGHGPRPRHGVRPRPAIRTGACASRARRATGTRVEIILPRADAASPDEVAAPRAAPPRRPAGPHPRRRRRRRGPARDGLVPVELRLQRARGRRTAPPPCR